MTQEVLNIFIASFLASLTAFTVFFGIGVLIILKKLHDILEVAEDGVGKFKELAKDAMEIFSFPSRLFSFLGRGFYCFKGKGKKKEGGDDE